MKVEVPPAGSSRASRSTGRVRHGHDRAGAKLEDFMRYTGESRRSSRVLPPAAEKQSRALAREAVPPPSSFRRPRRSSRRNTEIADQYKTEAQSCARHHDTDWAGYRLPQGARIDRANGQAARPPKSRRLKSRRRNARRREDTQAKNPQTQSHQGGRAETAQ